MRKIMFIVPSLMFMCVNSCSHTKQNIATGDTIIKKIELYKSENGVLPNSLQDIKQNEIINNVLFCYEKIDSVSYMVWFGTTLGEGVYYYSDTQQWEDRLRKMKE